MFTERDLEQSPDVANAESIALTSGADVTITEAGIYVFTGAVDDVTVIVEADDEANVQLVLDGVTVRNVGAPPIMVRSADKVFVTTTTSDNHLEVTGTFVADGTTAVDAVVFSRDDLVLNGTGTLTVVSARGNGVSCKDTLKVTGGTLSITSALDGLEAHDSIRVAGGTISIDSDKDALHAGDDDTLGYIYVAAGALAITAADDGLRGTTFVQIDGGTIDIATSREGIEGTFIQINGGDISLYASDDGINGADKSTAHDVAIEVNGGTIFVEVGSGDTDGFDSNGDITVNDGLIDVVAQSAFDADGVATLNGGTVTVNGEVITEIVQTGPGGGGPGVRL
jgi:hypothetical protein